MKKLLQTVLVILLIGNITARNVLAQATGGPLPTPPPSSGNGGQSGSSTAGGIVGAGGTTLPGGGSTNPTGGGGGAFGSGGAGAAGGGAIPAATPQHIYNRYFNNLTEEDFFKNDAPRDSTGFGYLGEVYNNTANISLSARNPCTSGCGNDFPVVPGKVQLPLDAMFARNDRTYLQGMASQDLKQREEQALSKALSVTKIARYLAEPAIARGSQDATDTVNAAQTNALLADLRLIAVANENPGMKPFMDAYFACVQKNKPLMGLLGAQKACQDDVGTVANPIPVGNAGKYDFASLPSAKDPKTNQIPSGQQALKIKLSSLLFNQEVGNSILVSGGANIPANYKSPIELKTDWQGLVGDVEFTITKASNQPLTADYKVLRPEELTLGNGQQGLPSAKYYKERKVDPRYMTLKKLVKHKCERQNLQAGLYTQQAEYELDMKKISLPGFLVTPTVVSTFLGGLADVGTKSGTMNVSVGTNNFSLPVGQWDCDQIDESQTTDELNNNGKPVKDIYRQMYFFARLSGLAEFMIEGLMMSQSLRTLSIGVGNESEMRKMGEDLLCRALGVEKIEDIRPTLDMLLEQLRSFQGYNIERSVAREGERKNAIREALEAARSANEKK